MAGAPKRNGNAEGLGLYASNPPREVQVLADAQPTVLAGFARGMGEEGLWIAESMSDLLGVQGLSGKGYEAASRMIGLYAAVAHECFQTCAELEGVAGIKPAPLGNLSDWAYERLMSQQAKALELILNQCMVAARRLREAEEIRAGEAETLDGKKTLPTGNGLLVFGKEGLEPHPALQSLAGHMRSAKRALREMAANKIWKERGQELETDLGERLLEVIQKK